MKVARHGYRCGHALDVTGFECGACVCSDGSHLYMNPWALLACDTQNLLAMVLPYFVIMAAWSASGGISRACICSSFWGGHSVGMQFV